jgi:ABC-type multidrug transport system fused ATPase/permease subunit
LHRVSFTIQPGEQVGLVGASGAGKSTILYLLLRFYRPSSGSILLDGQDLAGCARHAVRDALAYVPQEGVLFDGTIRDNLVVGNPAATGEQIRTACEAAQAWAFIEQLPDGLQTQTGDRGLKLSAGQRQRLAAARALLKDAPVLLLDEATSALDTRTEQLFGDALRRSIGSRTAIIVAHRLSTVISLPRLLFLHEGVIADQGSHEELMERCEAYREIAGSVAE